MIDRSHDLSIASQAKALNISRSSVYYLPRAVPAADLAIMRRMDQLHLDFPFAGSRMLRDLLNAEGVQHLAQHCRAPASAALGGRQQWLDPSELGVGDIGCVATTRAAILVASGSSPHRSQLLVPGKTRTSQPADSAHLLFGRALKR